MSVKTANTAVIAKFNAGVNEVDVANAIKTAGLSGVAVRLPSPLRRKVGIWIAVRTNSII